MRPARMVLILRCHIDPQMVVHRGQHILRRLGIVFGLRALVVRGPHHSAALHAPAGNDGRDILIGGVGLDTLNGGLGEDIIIGGSTSWDSNVANLQNIMARWLAASAYNVRITDLKTNVPQLLAASTVFNDGSADNLTGGGDLDWFMTEATDSVADFNTPAGEVNDVFRPFSEGE